MSAVCLARFPLELNLSPLHQALAKHNIPHRFTEEQQQQVLWLGDKSFEPQAIEVINTFIASSEQPDIHSNHAAAIDANNVNALQGDAYDSNAIKNDFVQSLRVYCAAVPITMSLIVLGFLGYCIVAMSWYGAYEFMTFTPIQIVGAQVFAAPWQWQELWRALSPVFLHFGIGHIAFNAMAMLQMGTAVERMWGAKWYALVCLSAALIGNCLQYFWEHSPMFGGLSGIVYGVFTFNFITQRVNPAKAFILPRGMYIWLAVFLVAGFTPFFSVLFGVQVANGAHLGGALGGALVACLANRNSLFAHFKSY